MNCNYVFLLLCIRPYNTYCFETAYYKEIDLFDNAISMMLLCSTAEQYEVNLISVSNNDLPYCPGA